MARPHNALRTLMREHDINSEVLSRELKISRPTLSRKMNGHSPFDQNEMWQIMSILQQPAYRLHEIFPRNGANEIRRKGA